LKYHERNIPYQTVTKKYTYEQATSLLQATLGNLDPEFLKILNIFIDKGRIDVYPRKGKRGGAFCAYHLLAHPVYILLNYADTLEDVLTIAHEMGHAINDELIKLKQNALHFGTPLSTAEVASTFMEDFVLEEVLKNADEEERLSIMMMKLNSDVSSIFRQIACFKFEQDLHRTFRESGYLSKEDIGVIFQKHMKAYMGPGVEQSPGSENWWVYWHHIRYFFYVYSYASGLLISKSLQRSVKKDKKYVGKVKAFLSTGLAESPVEIFDKLGIDITKKSFWENGIKEIRDLLAEATELATKLGKI
jgi:oligoendopeptidase F